MIDYSKVQVGDILIIKASKQKIKVIQASKYGIVVEIDNYIAPTKIYHGKCAARRLDYLE